MAPVFAWTHRPCPLYAPDERVLEENRHHCAALAPYFFWYNWVRIHKTLRVSPAMAACLTDKLMDMSDLVAMIDAAKRPKERGHYEKQAA